MAGATTGLPMPSTSDELTADWLTAALRSTGTIGRSTITGFTKATIGTGVGILGELARVEPAYDSAEEGAPASFVAKFASPAKENRELASAYGFYNNEVQFYMHLAGRLPVRVPDCYYIEFDPGEGRFVLLIEDLTDLRLGDQLAGCSVQEAGDLATAIARVHARTWNENDLANHDWLPPVNAPHYLALVPESFRQGWAAAQERYPGVIPQALKDLDGVYLPNVLALQNRLASAPRCLAHGDFRLDNVFFGPGGEHVIIDWQITGRARGPYDIGYLMSQSIGVSDRRSGEKGIIERYHQTLVDGGVEGYSIEDCWADYKRALMFCVTYPVSSAAMDPGNDRGRALVEAMLTRALTAVLDLNTVELLGE